MYRRVWETAGSNSDGPARSALAPAIREIIHFIMRRPFGVGALSILLCPPISHQSRRDVAHSASKQIAWAPAWRLLLLKNAISVGLGLEGAVMLIFAFKYYVLSMLVQVLCGIAFWDSCAELRFLFSDFFSQAQFPNKNTIITIR